MRSDRDSAGPAFLKMHGLGNDFVVIDARGRPGGDPVTPARARAIGDRRRGVGFDQLAVILDDEEADARLVFWNADGSTAGACGNATRCVASRLMNGSGRLTLRTERGILPCEALADGRVRVDMGPPLTGWADVPLAREVDTTRLPLEGAPAACSMGNPHCTFFIDEAEAAPLTTRGPEVERDPLFPERANVQFVEVLSRTRARVRVWERGVGVTLASGSSSCAVLVNAVRRGLMDRRATLILDGGEIDVEWPADEAGVVMTGPVATAFEGVIAAGLWGAE
ncbi:MAG: diaminopimelate epimerase [Pseudomonadota bacterium]